MPAASGGGSEGRATEGVAAALRELGRTWATCACGVCCFLEGIEMTERRLGWSARSGKIVLRLALQRRTPLPRDLRHRIAADRLIWALDPGTERTAAAAPFRICVDQAAALTGLARSHVSTDSGELAP